MDEQSKGPMTYYVGVVIMIALVITVGSLSWHYSQVDPSPADISAQR